MLDGLDLEETDQVATKECQPMSKSVVADDVVLDAVASEMDSWMKGFESPMSSIKKERDEKNLEIQHSSQSNGLKVLDTLNRARLYIPSGSSAFSQVSTRKEDIQSSIDCCSSTAENHEEILTEKSSCGNDKLSPFEKPNEASSICDAQFLSPAASAVSDDSGYDDSGAKVGSLLFLPSLLDKKNELSCGIVKPDKKMCSAENNLNILETGRESGTMQCNEITSPLSSEILTSKGLECSAEESLKPCDSVQKSSSDGISDVKGDDIVVENTFSTLCKTSHIEKSISKAPLNLVSPKNIALAYSEDGNYMGTTQHKITDQSLPLPDSEALQKKVGRPRGRPTKTPQVEPRRTIKRQRTSVKREEMVDTGSASLRKGLTSLLQSPPTFQVRKDGSRHHK